MISSENDIKGNNITKQKTLKNRYIAEIIIELTATFLKSSGSLRTGIKKYKYAKQLKVNMLFNPKKRVLSIPNPNTGSNLCGTKTFAAQLTRTTMLTKTIGVSKKFICAIGFIPNLATYTLGIRNSNNKNTKGLSLK